MLVFAFVMFVMFVEMFLTFSRERALAERPTYLTTEAGLNFYVRPDGTVYTEESPLYVAIQKDKELFGVEESFAVD
jgi:hypothetical protein